MSYSTENKIINDKEKIIRNKESYNNSHVYDSQTMASAMVQWIDTHTERIIVMWDVNRKITFVSQSIKEILGFDPNTLIGTHGTELLSQRDRIKLKNRFNNDLENAQGQVIYFKLKDDKGTYYQMECEIEKITRNDHSYFIGILTDLSKEVNKRNKLIESEKMSIAGQFAAGIAHEIRNPLTSIKGFLQLLQSGVTQKDAYYKIMIDEINKLESITSELLFISKPLTNKKKTENLSSMINDVMILLRSQVKSKNIMWDIKQIDASATFRCDRSQIKQVLINLIKNAIEAIEDNGTIKIEVNIVNSNIELIISDDGVGIDEEMIHKMNDPFFTTKEGGTGLGLMISKQILDQHDASMNFSQNENNGCTVHLLFPNFKKTAE